MSRSFVVSLCGVHGCSALEYGRDTFRLPEKEMVTEERPLCHALVVEEIQEPAEGDRRFALARDLGYFEYQWFRSNDELVCTPHLGSPSLHTLG